MLLYDSSVTGVTGESFDIKCSVSTTYGYITHSTTARSTVAGGMTSIELLGKEIVQTNQLTSFTVAVSGAKSNDILRYITRIVSLWPMK